MKMKDVNFWFSQCKEYAIHQLTLYEKLQICHNYFGQVIVSIMFRTQILKLINSKHGQNLLINFFSLRKSLALLVKWAFSHHVHYLIFMKRKLIIVIITYLFSFLQKQLSIVTLNRDTQKYNTRSIKLEDNIFTLKIEFKFVKFFTPIKTKYFC